MKKLQIGLWLLVAFAVGGFGFLYPSNNDAQQSGENRQVAKLGGPFDLVNHRGEAISHDDLLGQNHAMFFGFTHCPDICPTTLLEAAGWLKALDKDADKIDMYFFTVDPERDTPEVLKDYVEAFDSRITAITGNPQKVSETIRSYKVYTKRVDLDDDDYTVDHSAFVLLFNKTGEFKGTISYGENTDTALAKLRKLIENG